LLPKVGDNKKTKTQAETHELEKGLRNKKAQQLLSSSPLVGSKIRSMLVLHLWLGREESCRK
jgi:hypothetical protein